MQHRNNTMDTNNVLFKSIDDAQNYINKLPANINTEIELRYGDFIQTYDSHRFINGISSRDFHRLLFFFTASSQYRPTFDSLSQQAAKQSNNNMKLSQPEHFSDDIFTNAKNTNYSKSYGGGCDDEVVHKYRQTTVVASSASAAATATAAVAPPSKIMYKHLLKKLDLTNEYIRVVINEERPLEIIPDTAVHLFNRTKERWSFVSTQESHLLYGCRIDLSRVTFVKSNGGNNAKNTKNRVTYEFEIEKTRGFINLPRVVKFMQSLVQNSRHPMSHNNTMAIMWSFNDMFGKRTNNNILFDPLCRPTNIYLKHLFDITSLAVSNKADGERKILYIPETRLNKHTPSMYLVHPPKQISRFMNIELNVYKALYGTMFDCEIIADNLKQPSIVLIFDILFYHNNDVRNKSFKERYTLMRTIMSTFCVPGIQLKQFYFAADTASSQQPASSMYRAINNILRAPPNKQYRNDGLIFNVINDHYSTDMRVYKWKPPNELTIDFLVKPASPPSPQQCDTAGTSSGASSGATAAAYELFSIGPNHRLVQFTGTKRFPCSGTVMLSPQLITYHIVEMMYSHTDQQFVFVKLRSDRDQPNYHSTAIGIWHDINEPITESIITGVDLSLMRRYHNMCKIDMITKYSGNYCVDIGAGKGGDCGKWTKKSTNILAVEPNAAHLQLFTQRLQSYNYVPQAVDGRDGDMYIYKSNDILTRVKLLNCGGENAQMIVDTFFETFPDTFADSILMFNVLTFFFKCPTMLESLMGCIDSLLKPGGYFLGMVMDSHKTLNLLNGQQRYTDPDSGWEIERVTDSSLSSSPSQAFGNQIKINIPNTIVDHQTEYLVDFDELCAYLQTIGITLVSSSFLANNNLSPSQQRLSECYRSFVFVR